MSHAANMLHGITMLHAANALHDISMLHGTNLYAVSVLHAARMLMLHIGCTYVANGMLHI